MWFYTHTKFRHDAVSWYWFAKNISFEAYFDADENTCFDENVSFEVEGLANFDADEDDQWSPLWEAAWLPPPSLPPTLAPSAPPGQRPNVTAHYTAP